MWTYIRVIRPVNTLSGARRGARRSHALIEHNQVEPDATQHHATSLHDLSASTLQQRGRGVHDGIVHCHLDAEGHACCHFALIMFCLYGDYQHN